MEERLNTVIMKLKTPSSSIVPRTRGRTRRNLPVHASQAPSTRMRDT